VAWSLFAVVWIHLLGAPAGSAQVQTAAATPQTAITSHPPSNTISTAATFRFSASAAGASFQCQLDASRFIACSNPKTYFGLTRAAHTFRVRAIRAGVADPSPARFAWRVVRRVAVGPGLVDASVRELVRTAGGRVYVFAADDTAQKEGIGPGVIRAWRGNRVGVPTAFAEVDCAHRPSATGIEHVLGSPDVRLGKKGVVHLLYVNETNANLLYRTFSTRSNRWGGPHVLATGVTVSTHVFKRAGTANALIFDDRGVLHVVYAKPSSLVYRRRTATGWTAPITVPTGTNPIHPQLAADAHSRLHLTWLDQGGPSIRYARRLAGKRWSAAQTVAGTNVLDNGNLDQGPSIATTSAGTPYVLFLNSSDYVRVRYRAFGRWHDVSPPGNLYAHTPQIYARGGDVYVFLGHDAGIRYGYVFKLRGRPWSRYRALTTAAQGTLDGSASIRWDPLRETNRRIIDTAFFDEDKDDNQTWLPRLYYMGVKPG
jgi:hypothetical protein